MCLSAHAVIAALLSDLIPISQFSSDRGTRTRLTTHSVSVVSGVKSVAVTECKLLGHFNEVLQLQPHFKVAMETFKPLMTAGGSVSDVFLVVMMSRIMVVSLLR